MGRTKSYRPVICVRCPSCQRWYDEQNTEILNIEADFQERDIVTFICPTCKTEKKSMRAERNPS